MKSQPQMEPSQPHLRLSWSCLKPTQPIGINTGLNSILTKRLYKRVSPFVHRSICPSVRPFDGPSVTTNVILRGVLPSVCYQLFSKSKNKGFLSQKSLKSYGIFRLNINGLICICMRSCVDQFICLFYQI